MIDVNIDYLIYNLQELNLNEKEIYLLLERLQGLRIYISEKRIFYYKLKKRYSTLISQYYSKKEIIKILSIEFEKSQKRIRMILNDLENNKI